MLLTKSNTIQKNIAVLGSDKDIQPLNNSEHNELDGLLPAARTALRQACLITDLEFATHKMLTNGESVKVSKSEDFDHFRSK